MRPGGLGRYLLTRLMFVPPLFVAARTLNVWGYLAFIAVILVAFIIGDRIDIYQARKEAEDAKDSGDRIT